MRRLVALVALVALAGCWEPPTGPSLTDPCAGLGLYVPAGCD